jgi:hypothetical protein
MRGVHEGRDCNSGALGVLSFSGEASDADRGHLVDPAGLRARVATGARDETYVATDVMIGSRGTSKHSAGKSSVRKVFSRQGLIDCGAALSTFDGSVRPGRERAGRRAADRRAEHRRVIAALDLPDEIWPRLACLIESDDEYLSRDVVKVVTDSR